MCGESGARDVAYDLAKQINSFPGCTVTSNQVDGESIEIRVTLTLPNHAPKKFGTAVITSWQDWSKLKDEIDGLLEGLD